MREKSVQSRMSAAKEQWPSSSDRRMARPQHNSPKTVEDFERERMGVASQE